MIRITEKSLIIEIPLKTQTALEMLNDFQTGLYDLINNIDYYKASPDQTSWGINKIMLLLSQMNLSQEQAEIINNELVKQGELLQKFNRA